MKTERLIGILSVLLQRDSVTAPELAERFEVSRRTVMRDIDALCAAGIPIVSRQGAGGGLSIMEGCRLDRSVLTGEELRDILAGLRALDSVNGTDQYRRLMDKLSLGSSDFMTGDQTVLIDLSSWYKGTLAPKISLIRSAIEGRRVLSFRYYAPGGESERQVEPAYLIFRWSSWYLWGWCRGRQDWRLFKLNRMDGLSLTDEVFDRRAAPMPDLSDERIFPGGIRVKALFEPECRWRLVEEFGTGCFEVQEDGRLLFRADYTDPEDLLTWLLTFRDKAELLEPEDLRRRLVEEARNILRRYGG